MEIYIITLVVLLIFSFLELRTNLTAVQHKAMSFFVFGLFVFQVGLRWQTGTDWDIYLLHFEETNTISDVRLTLTGFEQGYSYFVLIVNQLSKNYSVFLVIHALLFYFLIFSAFKRLSPYFFVTLMVFMPRLWGLLALTDNLLR